MREAIEANLYYETREVRFRRIIELLQLFVADE